MKSFLVIYHADTDAMKQMASIPPEEQTKGIEGWMIWAKKCGDKLVDMGAPLMGGKHFQQMVKVRTAQTELSAIQFCKPKIWKRQKHSCKGIHI